MNRQDTLASAPPVIRHPAAIALEHVGPSPAGDVRIRWHAAQSDALHELSLPLLVAWQLAIGLVGLLTGVRH